MLNEIKMIQYENNLFVLFSSFCRNCNGYYLDGKSKWWKVHELMDDELICISKTSANNNSNPQKKKKMIKWFSKSYFTAFTKCCVYGIPCFWKRKQNRRVINFFYL